jgi:hypothetical protein
MHFEILVEDKSGKELLDIIVPKLINVTHNTYKVIPYKGIGRIPKNLHTVQDPSKRILLEQLPRLLKGYGKSFTQNEVVIVVVDCDDRVCKEFKQELNGVLASCIPAPQAFFRIAIEEREAWLLGDISALQKAFPKYDKPKYDTYKQDSIIGTWEKLADITLSADAARRLKKEPFNIIGKQKSDWVKKISVYMDIHNNASPSFNCFKNKLEQLAKNTEDECKQH